MFTSDYLKLPHLCLDKKPTVFKNMTIILVEIVRMTLDAFWSEKSTICQRNINEGLALKMLTITPFNTVSWYLLWKY